MDFTTYVKKIWGISKIIVKDRIKVILITETKTKHFTKPIASVNIF